MLAKGCGAPDGLRPRVCKPPTCNPEHTVGHLSIKNMSDVCVTATAGMRGQVFHTMRWQLTMMRREAPRRGLTQLKLGYQRAYRSQKQVEAHRTSTTWALLCDHATKAGALFTEACVSLKKESMEIMNLGLGCTGSFFGKELPSQVQPCIPMQHTTHLRYGLSITSHDSDFFCEASEDRRGFGPVKAPHWAGKTAW